MLIKPSHLMFLFLFLTACNNTTAPEQNQDYKDTLQQVATTAEQVQTTPKKDFDAEQINAQDTLFEDGSRPSSWANAGFNDPVAFKQFVAHFKEWVKTDNIDEIAAHIRFPLVKIKTATEFRKRYAQIFHQQLKDKIVSQRLDRIFRNIDGAMISDGAIWFAPSDNGYVITAINN